MPDETTSTENPGDGGPTPAETGSPGQGGDAQPPGDGGAGGGDAPPSRSSVLDFAPKGEAEADPDAWKLPDGLELPEHLVGTSAEDTLGKLATAYRGARQELSTRKKADGTLDGAVPKELTGYTFDAIEADPETDPVLADLTSEDSQQYLDPAREVAMELGIPDATFAKFMHGYVSKLSENGLNLAVNPEEAARINGEAEMEQLSKDLGQQGADQALRQIDTFAQKLAQRGVLADKSDLEEFAQMVGTAKGLQIMQRIIVAELGERAIPKADGVEGAPTQEEAYEAHRQALSMPPGSDREAAVERAEAQLAKALQNSGQTGQIRSRVL